MESRTDGHMLDGLLYWQNRCRIWLVYVTVRLGKCLVVVELRLTQQHAIADIADRKRVSSHNIILFYYFFSAPLHSFLRFHSFSWSCEQRLSVAAPSAFPTVPAAAAGVLLLIQIETSVSHSQFHIAHHTHSFCPLAATVSTTDRLYWQVVVVRGISIRRISATVLPTRWGRHRSATASAAAVQQRPWSTAAAAQPRPLPVALPPPPYWRRHRRVRCQHNC